MKDNLKEIKREVMLRDWHFSSKENETDEQRHVKYIHYKKNYLRVLWKNIDTYFVIESKKLTTHNNSRNRSKEEIML